MRVLAPSTQTTQETGLPAQHQYWGGLTTVQLKKILLWSALALAVPVHNAVTKASLAHRD